MTDTKQSALIGQSLIEDYQHYLEYWQPLCDQVRSAMKPYDINCSRLSHHHALPQGLTMTKPMGIARFWKNR